MTTQRPFERTSKRSRSWFGNHQRFGISSLLIASALTGCGGSGEPIGRVSGTVKFDGKPLPQATVIFQPDGGGRPSSGFTDDQGQYSLASSPDEQGAKVGKHLVRISTFQSAYDDGKPHPTIPEKVPDKFNAKAATNPLMTKEVADGKNTIDFDLDSKGTVIQPDAKPTKTGSTASVTPAAHTSSGPTCP